MCDNQISCIDAKLKCDGHKHCPDGSDEIAVNCFNATACPELSFKCSYGACIDGWRRCNNIFDCADKSDEIFCTENVLVYRNMQGTCRYSRGQDEKTMKNINTSLLTFRSEDEMQCATSKECINIEDMCDGQANCSDGSDETLELCGSNTCPFGFRCAYGACVIEYARCNGTAECLDASDEAWESCGHTRKFPKITTTTTTTTTTSKPSLGPRFNPTTGGLLFKIPQ